MNKNLRDKIALHRPSDERSDQGTPMCSCGHDLGLDETWGEHVADAVLAVVGPELERLRAEVERLRGSTDRARQSARRAGLRATAAEAERDDLRARLAKVEFPLTLERVHEIVSFLSQTGRAGLLHANTLNIAMGASARRRAALASVPEPSDSEPCTCTSYVVDYSDPDRYHAENIDREDDPACPVHGDSEPHAPCCDACGGSGASDEASSNGLCWDCRGTGCAHETSDSEPRAGRRPRGR